LRLELAEKASVSLKPADLPGTVAQGLYVHVPFCFHKCGYCDFYSITRQTEARMQLYVELLLREADLWLNTNGPEVRPATVFLGGGTPSLLPLEMMRQLIRGLRDRFDFSKCTEWTIEVNPATVSLEYCQMLREEGATRLSMGAQSFDPAELVILERHHQPDDVARSIELARLAGIERLNVDLIFAIPGQSMQSWLRSLQMAMELKTEHLSCYALTYEPNTPMAVRKRLGQFESAPENLELEMLHETRRRLGDAGLAAYEISNFSAPGGECRHNLMYWSGGNYVGLGPAAASHVDGWRWKNRPHLGEWERAVAEDQLPATDVETLTPGQRAGELAMLSLRLSRGLVFAEYAARIGYDAPKIFADAIARYSRQGLILADKTGIRLTDAGIGVADGVAAEFLAAAGR
jgi:oxygen-independent coproporphyrinogen III oxidase